MKEWGYIESYDWKYFSVLYVIFAQIAFFIIVSKF